MPKFLIIDEGFGCLDTANLGLVTQLLHGIKKHFDFILIISHIGELQNLSDIKLEITRSGSISSIRNTDKIIEYMIKGTAPQESKPATSSATKSEVATTATIVACDKLEVIEKNGTKYYYCKYCKKELQMRGNAQTIHLNSQGHKNKVGKK